MQRQPQATKLRIGQLATTVGLNPKTIRYYEQLGLLPSPARTPTGYRLYEPVDVERLHFIRKAKALGLSLTEIGEILALRQAGTAPCCHVLDVIDRKLAAVVTQRQALEVFEVELRALRDAAQDTMNGNAQTCSVIEQATVPARTRNEAVVA
ncbi:heavy metal-responsive transcriptional regulator [Scytonema tolypothrichoides VB-61278]|nr:heavy metal-responsive transcriptional regulator [Scytonema tolypothrichoides VB-61278]